MALLISKWLAVAMPYSKDSVLQYMLGALTNIPAQIKYPSSGKGLFSHLYALI